MDLTREQIARGHKVGIIADSLAGGEMAEAQFAALTPHLALGLERLPIHRLPHPSDFSALISVSRRIAALRPDVVHGHGSKGGVYARMTGLFAGRRGPVRIYTPHGGSLNYEPGSLSHRVFMMMEALLAARTDALLFESAYIAGRFEAFVGKPKGLARIIPNGISEGEFAPVAPRPDAADLLYVGEFRDAKGIDTLIDAVSLLKQRGVSPSVQLIGDGADRDQLEARAALAGVAAQMNFGTPLRARDAFALGKAMIVPSRFESLPYIVLEAASAQIPLVATNVGGMAEIFGPYADRLIEPDDPVILADALERLLAEPQEKRAHDAQTLADHVASRFSVSKMAGDVIDGYRAALMARAATS
ncbi:glycosyltransferase family 4 protein [Methylocystis parvus]|uniref:Glycosyltransferase family 4 protein n=2 Tax=Methylocystis parvus TaxID=134 RepID=A0A6B8M465_9HYPH|nr:glycosyltransferase family 4 protein [Methylocystis parvus]